MNSLLKSLIALLLFLPLITFSQTNFKWDIVIDSIEGSKSDLYSKTKLYISEAWRSAQDVIQNDDFNAGIIVVKGKSIQSLYYQLNDHVWIFSYTVRFMIKDNRCRIIIDDVICISARAEVHQWPLLPVGDEYPERGLFKTSLNKERYLTVMKMLRESLQSIVDGYEKALKGSSLIDENW